MNKEAVRLLASHPLVVILVLLVLWEIGFRVFEAPLHMIPLPSGIVESFLEQWSMLLWESLVTTWESVAGVILAIVFSIPLAFALISSETLSRAIYPIIVASQAVPKIAVAPLFIVWFGYGIESKILVAFLICFFPLLIDGVMGLSSVGQDRLRLLRSMGANGWQVFRKLRFPAALPHFFSGLKVAVTLAVVGALVGEFMGGSAGLGYVLLRAQAVVDTELIFVAIGLLSVIGIVLFYAVVLIERIVIPWHVKERG